jgi:hypothetical protein
MLKQFLKKIGLWVGNPRSLTHKEESELIREGMMKSYETAWESACGRYYFIRNNKTSELRAVEK